MRGFLPPHVSPNKCQTRCATKEDRRSANGEGAMKFLITCRHCGRRPLTPLGKLQNGTLSVEGCEKRQWPPLIYRRRENELLPLPPSASIARSKFLQIRSRTPPPPPPPSIPPPPLLFIRAAEASASKCWTGDHSRRWAQKIRCGESSQISLISSGNINIVSRWPNDVKFDFP